MLQQLLDVNKAKGDIKKVDGTNYGCPYTGYYDQPFTLLQKLLVSTFKCLEVVGQVPERLEE